MPALAATRRGPRERGFFTFIEMLLATLVLALAATATAYWVETVNGLSMDADEQTVGQSLVKVMEGIVAPLAFREPGGMNFGPEPGEQLGDYDDLDDFHGLMASPPLDFQRQPQATLAEWSVAIVVEPVDPETLQVTATSDLRRVRVTAERKGRTVAESWWLRARAPAE
ncbi:MAG: hypothetical protein HY812_14835 [Planctomycetes bacterium]|nr:hypothetical protein [Planctomycetota bacterium]